jgi:hypothetical protein
MMEFAMILKNVVLNGPIKRQYGSVMVLAAMMLVMILSFAALAIDIGYSRVVRNELQNAADAAALAGAAKLYPVNASGNPNFTAAHNQTVTALGWNKAANAVLSNSPGYVVSTGYWNFAGIPSSGWGTKKAIPPDTNYPAVKVTINKDETAGGNGAVNTFFAKVFGTNSTNNSATGVAVAGVSPGAITTGMFPFTISKCVYDWYTNPANDSSNHNYSTTGLSSIIIAQSDTNGNALPDATSTCNSAGQLTTLYMGSTSNNDVKTLMSYTTYGQSPDPTNPAPQYKINAVTSTALPTSSYNMAPHTYNAVTLVAGTLASAYSQANDCSAQNPVVIPASGIPSGTYFPPGVGDGKPNPSYGNGNCQFNTIAITCPDTTCQPPQGAVIYNTLSPIMGLACIRLLGATSTGSQKSVSFQLIKPGTIIYGGSGLGQGCQAAGYGIGPSNGIFMPPKIVNYFNNSF